MRKIVILLILISFMLVSVSAMDFSPPEVPDTGEMYMPEDTESFAEGLWYVIRSAFDQLLPELSVSAQACFKIVAVMLVISLVSFFPSVNTNVIGIAGTIFIGVILLEPSHTFIQLGTQTVAQMNEYNKLLLPVLTGALAAQGGATTSAALYAGTAFFSTLLSTAVNSIIVPMLYAYLCLILVKAAVKETVIGNFCSSIKWLISWGLKIILYVFTAFIGITGVVSGSADASAVKIAKLAISGMVPVVGSIISEASESILVSAGVMKNAAGIYGILAIIAVFIGPFLKIGAQYLMLKITGSLCKIFGPKSAGELLMEFSEGLGMVLAMIGTVCLLLLIGSVCFMKGVS